MKKKNPLNQIIYLPDYFVGNIAQSFQKEDLEILYWDFGKEVNETVKLQIEQLLNHAVKTIKDKEERRNRYLLLLKYLFCYAENSGLQDWEAHVWYVEKLNIAHERYSLSSTIESFYSTGR